PVANEGRKCDDSVTNSRPALSVSAHLRLDFVGASRAPTQTSQIYLSPPSPLLKSTHENARSCLMLFLLLRRNLRFHARSHAGALLGVIIATAVLVGALAIGDCVRGTLTDLALARLGQVHDAIAPSDRFFRAQLAA